MPAAQMRNDQVKCYNREGSSRTVRALRERMDAVIDRLGKRTGANGSDDWHQRPSTKPLPTETGERSVDGTSSQVPGE